jgi:hypothetical protein
VAVRATVARGFLVVLLASSLPAARRANAAADLTGSWKVTYSLGGPPIGTIYFPSGRTGPISP